MEIWKFISDKLNKNQKLVLLLVIDSNGSSPGRKGFKMAIAEDSELSGSIGGGVMEYNLVEKARKHFQNPLPIFSLMQDHAAEHSKASTGMICSGNQQVAFYPLESKYLPVIEKILQSESGSLIFNEEGIQFISEELKEAHSEIQSENKWAFYERLGFAQKLYVFGAGHVSMAVSKLFRDLGFYITVFDNRTEDLNTFKNNDFAHHKTIIDYNNVAEFVPEGDHIYVMIMTFAHKADQKILSQLLEKKVKYLGMMGSEKKVDTIFSNLKKEGINETLLKNVDAPIGIPIKSQTPEEIAVSIAAKVIQVKNG